MICVYDTVLYATNDAKEFRKHKRLYLVILPSNVFKLEISHKV